MSTLECGLGAARLRLAVATVGGVGMIRPAPGTWGSLVAALSVAVCASYLPSWCSWQQWAVAAVIATVACIWSCPAASRRFGRKDPGQVVVDEVAGIWAAAAVVPQAYLVAEPWLVAGLIFVVFRVLDIAKPWPIPYLERAPGGLGVAIDDVGAGLVAGAAVVPLCM